MLRNFPPQTPKVLLTNRGHINLIDAGLTSVKGAQQVISDISSRRLVTQLDLSHNRLGDEGCAILFRFLCSDFGRRYCIEKIRLNSNRIGDYGLAAIMEYLSNNIYLKELYLQNNLFSGSDISLCTGLASAMNTSHIEVFTLTTNRDLSDAFMHHFLPKLDCESLIELHLSDVGLTSASTPYLVEYVASQRCRLHTLKLNGNRLGFRGVRGVIRAIERSNYSISTIEMYSNDHANTDASDVTSADDDDDIPTGLDSWKENEKLLRPVMIRNEHLRRMTRKDALSLLPVARILLMHPRPIDVSSGKDAILNRLPTQLAGDPDSLFPFSRLPMEIQLYILSFLAPYLSAPQRSRIFSYASARATLPPLLPSLHSGTNIWPVSKCATAISDGSRSLDMGYKVQVNVRSVWEGSARDRKHDAQTRWLTAMGCVSFEPDGAF